MLLRPRNSAPRSSTIRWARTGRRIRVPLHRPAAGNYVPPSRLGLRRTLKGERGARTGAKPDVRMRAEPTADWASRMIRLAASGSDAVSDRKRFSIANSSASFGYPSENRSVKRSSCASGNGNVHSISIGFSVAITNKGDGRLAVTPSTVTWRSPIASKRADCVRGEARLISSARTISLKTGPGRKSNACLSGRKH